MATTVSYVKIPAWVKHKRQRRLCIHVLFHRADMSRVIYSTDSSLRENVWQIIMQLWNNQTLRVVREVGMSFCWFSKSATIRCCVLWERWVGLSVGFQRVQQSDVACCERGGKVFLLVFAVVEQSDVACWERGGQVCLLVFKVLRRRNLEAGASDRGPVVNTLGYNFVSCMCIVLSSLRYIHVFC